MNIKYFLEKIISQLLNILDHKVKRGSMFWNIETRPISDNDYCIVGNNKCYYKDAVILHVAYKPYKGDIQYVKFTTNDKNNCCHQFIDWLRLQNKTVNIIMLLLTMGEIFICIF